MRVQSLTLSDFRSFAEARFALETPITFITGRNGAGKSTTIDALRWVLTGRCRGTDARGAGSDALLRADPKVTQMRVEVGLADADDAPLAVTRKQTPKTSLLTVGEESGSKEAVAAALYNRLGMTPAIVEACLNTEAFLALHHADAKRLLLDVLDVWVPVKGEQLSLQQVESRYQEWFEQRRTRKAALAAIRVPPAPSEPAPDVEALEAQLAALRDEEKTLLAASSQADGRRREITRHLQQLAQDVGRREATVARLANVHGGGIRSAPSVPVEDALAEAQRALAALEGEEADRGEDGHRVALVDAQGRLRTLTDTHQALAQHSPDRGCVLDGSVPCKTPAKAFTGQLAKLQAQIDTLQAEAEATAGLVEAGRKRAREATVLREAVAALEQQAAAAAEGRAALAVSVESRARLEAELAGCAEDAAPSPALAALQARIAKGDAVIQGARDAAREAHEHAKAKAAAQAASRSLAEAEEWVDLLGPNGARVQALEQALGQFQASINSALERFGYRLRIVADPWLVLVNELPAELLSTSERLRVGIALQLAIAEASAFAFIAIDQVDLLDAENRALLGELLSLRGTVQVLAAATKDDGFEPPAIDGWTWYRVEKAAGVSRAVRSDLAVLA